VREEKDAEKEEEEEEEEEEGCIAVASRRRKRVLDDGEEGEDDVEQENQKLPQEAQAMHVEKLEEEPRRFEEDTTPATSVGANVASTSSKATWRTETETPSKLPAWVLKLQAAGVVDSSMPHRANDLRPEPCKDLPQVGKKEIKRTQQKKLKQTLLLDMFRKSFTGALAGDGAAACGHECTGTENQSAETIVSVATTSTPEGLPTVWKAALEGAFPSLRRLRRLRHVQPQEESVGLKSNSQEQSVGLKSDSEEQLSSDANSDSEASSSEAPSSEAETVEEVISVDDEGCDGTENDVVVEKPAQSEEIILSAEDYRRRREKLKLQRQQARKRKRKLRWEIEDIAEIRGEVERMISFGMSTMSEDDQKRWRDLVGAAFVHVPSVTTAHLPRVPEENATDPIISQHAAAVEASTTLINGRRLFGGRADDDGTDLYTLAAPVRQRSSFLKATASLKAPVQQKQAISIANSMDTNADRGENISINTSRGGFHQQELASRFDSDIVKLCTDIPKMAD